MLQGDDETVWGCLRQELRLSKAKNGLLYLGFCFFADVCMSIQVLGLTVQELLLINLKKVLHSSIN